MRKDSWFERNFLNYRTIKCLENVTMKELEEADKIFMRFSFFILLLIITVKYVNTSYTNIVILSFLFIWFWETLIINYNLERGRYR